MLGAAPARVNGRNCPFRRTPPHPTGPRPLHVRDQGTRRGPAARMRARQTRLRRNRTCAGASRSRDAGRCPCGEEPQHGTVSAASEKSLGVRSAGRAAVARWGRTLMTPAMELAPHKPSFLDLPYSHLSDRSLQFLDGQTCRPDELSHASSCHNEHIVNDLLGRGHLAVESCHANLVSSSTSRTASAFAPNSSRALGPRSLRLSALLIAMGHPRHHEVENYRTSACPDALGPGVTTARYDPCDRRGPQPG